MKRQRRQPQAEWWQWTKEAKGALNEWRRVLEHDRVFFHFFRPFQNENANELNRRWRRQTYTVNLLKCVAQCTWSSCSSVQRLDMKIKNEDENAKPNRSALFSVAVLHVLALLSFHVFVWVLKNVAVRRWVQYNSSNSWIGWLEWRTRQQIVKSHFSHTPDHPGHWCSGSQPVRNRFSAYFVRHEAQNKTYMVGLGIQKRRAAARQRLLACPWERGSSPGEVGKQRRWKGRIHKVTHSISVN